jgi:hypothetical protein
MLPMKAVCDKFKFDESPGWVGHSQTIDQDAARSFDSTLAARR